MLTSLIKRIESFKQFKRHVKMVSDHFVLAHPIQIWHYISPFMSTEY